MSAANRKISQLPEQTNPASTSYALIVNESGQNRKVTLANLVAAGGGGNGSGSAQSLNDLTDVSITNPASGHVIVYDPDNNGQQFVNQASLDGGEFF